MIRIRRPTRRAMSLLMAAPFVVTACTTAGDGATGDPVPAAPETAAAAATTLAPATIEPVAETATWLDIELTDVQSGEPFTLASLAGEVVAIEPMAIWCGNCKAQQDNVKNAYSDIEAAGVRFISLDIDPSEDPDSLARYADRHGYGWKFARSSREFSRAINDIFGPQILSAPSTPLIVLAPNGEVVVQDFGFHGPEQLLDILGEAAA